MPATLCTALLGTNVSHCNLRDGDGMSNDQCNHSMPATLCTALLGANVSHSKLRFINVNVRQITAACVGSVNVPTLLLSTREQRDCQLKTETLQFVSVP